MTVAAALGVFVIASRVGDAESSRVTFAMLSVVNVTRSQARFYRVTFATLSVVNVTRNLL